MKRLVLCILLFTLIALYGCNCGNSTGSSGFSSELDNEEFTEDLTETAGAGTVMPPDTTESLPPDIPLWDILEDNILNVTFKFNDQNNNYYINAPVTGRYRFSFDISDVNCSYSIRLSKTNHEEIQSTNNDVDFNVDLTEAETYVLEIIQGMGLPECTIKVDIPNPIKEVEDNKMFEKIRFIGQEDQYIFTPQLSGKYGFELDISNVEYSYNVKILDSKNNEIAEGDYSGISYKDYYINANLDENKTYNIFVTFDDYELEDDNLKYTIKIYEPNEIKYVNANTVNGEMLFGGQQDRYIFSPSATARYLLEFNDSNEQMYYEISFCDDNNYKQGPKSNQNWSVSFDLVKGKEYEITVAQEIDYGKYCFTITPESTE
ncbi:MAG: hypothetical protein IJT79_00340 [Ruminococcus sp.]|nr:hypothetical protein [Ruminococcus sp.]